MKDLWIRKEREPYRSLKICAQMYQLLTSRAVDHSGLVTHAMVAASLDANLMFVDHEKFDLTTIHLQRSI